MSRVFGRAYDVNEISRKLKETALPKYRIDRVITSWKDIETTPEKIIAYLPKEAVDFLSSKKIKITRNPLRLYTLTQIPDTDDDERFIEFTSFFPKAEFKRELMFYVGMLLSSYNPDSITEEYGIPLEYEDLLPLLIEYLYLKIEGKEDEFLAKHLEQLKRYSKTFPKYYDKYQYLEKLRREAELSEYDEEHYEEFQKEVENNDAAMINFVQDNITRLSSMEGVLGVIDSITSEEEIRKLILDLMINKYENRGVVLQERGIDSYGYKRLRKELETRKK